LLRTIDTVAGDTWARLAMSLIVIAQLLDEAVSKGLTLALYLIIVNYATVLLNTS